MLGASKSLPILSAAPDVWLPAMRTHVKDTGDPFVLQKNKEARAKSGLTLQWLHILTNLGNASTLFQVQSQSENATALLSASLSSAGPATLDNYFRRWRTLEAWIRHRSLSWSAINLQHVLDFLLLCRQGAKQDHDEVRTAVPAMVKGLRWVARHSGFDAMTNILHNSLLCDHLRSKTPFEKQEALPLPWAVLWHWEHRLLSGGSDLQETLALGAFLLASWSSLRFGDIQHVRLDSLSFERNVLRGICWRTKTSFSGSAFAVHAAGIASTCGTQTWVHVWLAALQTAWSLGRTSWGPQWTPDFLLGEPAKVPLRRPLSYQDALFTFRHLLQAPWMHSPLLNAPAALSCSLHSMKVTALAAAKQLRLSRDSRAEQGHHVPRSDSVQLYGRDDVSDALHVQEQIIRNIRQGWRPLRPLSRGSHPPLPDLAFPKTPLAADALWPQTTQLQDSISLFQPRFCDLPEAAASLTPPCSPPSDPQQEVAPLFVSDVEGSDSSSTSSSSSSQDQQVLVLDADEATFVYNPVSTVLHVASLTGLLRSKVESSESVLYIKCGSSSNERRILDAALDLTQ